MAARQTRFRVAIAAAVLTTIAAAVGCSTAGTSSATGTGPSSGTAQAVGTQANANKVVVPGVPTLAELYKGSYTPPPAKSPAGAKGKSVWWISCNQATPSCSIPAAAGAAAAKALGINFHVADGKFNVGGAFTTAIQTALAARPSAILLYGVACQLVQGALQQAKAQHVLVLGVNTPDCSDSGGPQLFSVHMVYGPQFPTALDFWKAYGAASADYIIDTSGGHAKIIDNAGSEPLQTFVDQGFRDELKKCAGCSIVGSVPYDSATLVPNGAWIQEFRAALVKDRDATAVYLPWDVMWNELGGAQAIRQSGDKLISFGGQAAPDGVAMVRQGLITAVSSAESPTWSGYAGIDAINRALQGKPQVPEGEGFELFTLDHGMPTTNGDYEPVIPFITDYMKAWQLAG